MKLVSTPAMRVFSCILVVLATFAVMAPTGNICSKGRDGSNLPRIARAVKTPAALRDDAMIVTVRRDGRIYFGSDELTGDQLPVRFRESVHSGSERKVYIQADARARYKEVAEVLDGIRVAGISNVAFLTDRRSPANAFNGPPSRTAASR